MSACERTGKRCVAGEGFAEGRSLRQYQRRTGTQPGIDCVILGMHFPRHFRFHSGRCNLRHAHQIRVRVRAHRLRTARSDWLDVFHAGVIFVGLFRFQAPIHVIHLSDFLIRQFAFPWHGSLAFRFIHSLIAIHRSLVSQIDPDLCCKFKRH